MKKAKIKYLQNKVIEIHNNLHRNYGKLEDFTNYLYDKVIDDVITDMDNKGDLIDYLEKFDGGNCLPYTWDCIEVMRNHMEGLVDYLNENDYIANTFTVGGKYDALDIPHMVWYALENYAHTMATEIDDIEEAYLYRELDSDIQDDIIQREVEDIDYDYIEREVATQVEEGIKKLDNKILKDFLFTCIDSDMIQREGMDCLPLYQTDIELDAFNLDCLKEFVNSEYPELKLDGVVDYMTGNTSYHCNIPVIHIEEYNGKIKVDCDTEGRSESVEWFILSSLVCELDTVLNDFIDGDIMENANNLFQSWSSDDAIHESLYHDMWALYNEYGDCLEN